MSHKYIFFLYFPFVLIVFWKNQSPLSFVLDNGSLELDYRITQSRSNFKFIAALFQSKDLLLAPTQKDLHFIILSFLNLNPLFGRLYVFRRKNIFSFSKKRVIVSFSIAKKRVICCWRSCICICPIKTNRRLNRFIQHIVGNGFCFLLLFVLFFFFWLIILIPFLNHRTWIAELVILLLYPV